MLYNFFTVELSSTYLDVLKDRLYCSSPDSRLRRSAQTAVFRLLKATVTLMAPILPFTAEEVWDTLPGFADKRESVHLEMFPEFEEEVMEDAFFREWESLRQIRDQVLKELEKAREAKLIRAMGFEVLRYLERKGLR